MKASKANTIQRVQEGWTIPKKIKVTVHINGKPCEMEIDTGSSYSIISRSTLSALGKQAFPKLRPLGVRLTDFQENRVPVAGIGRVDVVFKNHRTELPVVVAEGNRTSLLGLDWFLPLGISLIGINGLQTAPLDSVFQEFVAVFDGTLGCYKGLPISICLDPAVNPIQMRARPSPFAL